RVEGRRDGEFADHRLAGARRRAHQHAAPGGDGFARLDLEIVGREAEFTDEIVEQRHATKGVTERWPGWGAASPPDTTAPAGPGGSAGARCGWRVAVSLEDVVEVGGRPLRPVAGRAGAVASRRRGRRGRTDLRGRHGAGASDGAGRADRAGRRRPTGGVDAGGTADGLRGVDAATAADATGGGDGRRGLVVEIQ